jgi:hypothetical protein
MEMSPQDDREQDIAPLEALAESQGISDHMRARLPREVSFTLDMKVQGE